MLLQSAAFRVKGKQSHTFDPVTRYVSNLKACSLNGSGNHTSLEH